MDRPRRACTLNRPVYRLDPPPPEPSRQYNLRSRHRCEDDLPAAFDGGNDDSNSEFHGSLNEGSYGRGREMEYGESRAQNRRANALGRELSQLIGPALDQCPILPPEDSSQRYNMRRQRKETVPYQAWTPSNERRNKSRYAEHRHIRKRPKRSGGESDEGESSSGDDPPSASESSSSSSLGLSGIRRKHERTYKRYKSSIGVDVDLSSPLRDSHGRKLQRCTEGSMDVGAVTVDESVTWECIGGLQSHIKALKEMVTLPLLYPDVFDKFHIPPPSGVLFIGPPGTGKTLMARALANACNAAAATAIGHSGGVRKVSFFARKGADILSKWVGESEKQLRRLFETARRAQPSIIFFDEIDGLAPARAAANAHDHTHTAVVATLLALMDGLDQRGQVVVIGATNRVDTLDPALRRPGRFDREFYFPFPDRIARKEILKIHTSGWPTVDPQILDDLAFRTQGFCGADLKALCVEAPLRALRRIYPQIYDRDCRLKINLDQIIVDPQDWADALRNLTPAAHRAATGIEAQALALCPSSVSTNVNAASTSNQTSQDLSTSSSGPRDPNRFGELSSSVPVRGIPRHLMPLLSTRFGLLCDMLHQAGLLAPNVSVQSGCIQDSRLSRKIGKQVVWLRGECDGCGQSLLARSLLLGPWEGLPRFYVALSNIPTSLTDEEGLVRVFLEAVKAAPAVIHIPHLETWWMCQTPRCRETLRRAILDIPSGVPLIVLVQTSENSRPTLTTSGGATATAVACDETPFKECEDLSALLSSVAMGTMFTCPLPSLVERQAFFRSVVEELLTTSRSGSTSSSSSSPPPVSPLPVDPNPPPICSNTKGRSSLSFEQRTKEYEDGCLRQLRVCIRDTLLKLLNDRKFGLFSKPLDREECPQFYEEIETPLFLTDCLRRCSEHQYTSVQIFVHDIEQIVSNTKRYYCDAEADDRDAKAVGKAEQMLDHVLLDIIRYDTALVQMCETITNERRAKEGLNAKPSRAETATVGSNAEEQGMSQKLAATQPVEQTPAVVDHLSDERDISPTTNGLTSDSAPESVLLSTAQTHSLTIAENNHEKESTGLSSALEPELKLGKALEPLLSTNLGICAGEISASGGSGGDSGQATVAPTVCANDDATRPTTTNEEMGANGSTSSVSASVVVSPAASLPSEIEPTEHEIALFVEECAVAVAGFSVTMLDHLYTGCIAPCIRRAVQPQTGLLGNERKEALLRVALDQIKETVLRTRGNVVATEGVSSE